MSKEIFRISNQISIEEINKVYEENFEKIFFDFTLFENEWFFNAYNEYKDIDKYLILVHLIHKTFKTYNKHFYKMSFDKFYSNSHIEVEKISIIDLVKNLEISKETVRRKINELSKEGILIRKLKNIKLIRLNFNAKLEKNVFNLSRLIHNVYQKLNKKYQSSNLTREDIENNIRTNYTHYWNLFFNFQIPYILRWKKVYQSCESFYIYGLCALNQIFNAKKLSNFEKDQFFLSSDIFFDNLTMKNSRGLNPTTISDLSGIPRATVIRKLQQMLKKNLIIENNKNNLFSINNIKKIDSNKIQKEIFKRNQIEIKFFLKEIINLIL